MKAAIKVLLILFVSNLFFYCTTNKVPQGKYLLTKNKYKVEGKPNFSNDLPEYVKQKPNSKMFFVFPFGLWMYDFSEPDLDSSFEEFDAIIPKDRTQKRLDSILIKNGLPNKTGRSYWLQRMFFNIGSPPVIIDSSLAELSTKRLKKFYQKKGYFDAKTSFSVHPTAPKKASITYTIIPNQVTEIKTYDYDIPYQNMLTLYEKYKKNSFVETGKPLDQFVLTNEIARLEEIYKNNGYWGINSKSREIFFETDTLNKNKEVPLKLRVQRDTLVDSSNTFKQYYFGKITIHDYKDSQKNQLKNIDETEYQGYYIKRKNDKYYLNTFTNMMIIEPGKMYRLKDEITTKRRIYANNNFDISNYVTSYAKDSLINVDIYLTNKLKYDLDFSTDVQYSEIFNFGLSPGVTFKMRNLRGGAENLEIGLQGTFGTVNLEDTSEDYFFNAYELALQAKITYPRMLFPFANKFISKRLLPSSDLFFRINQQHNIGLGRINVNTGLNYYIQPRETIKQRLNLLNTQLSKITNPGNYDNLFPNSVDTRNQVFNDYFSVYPDAEEEYAKGQISADNLESEIIANTDYLDELDAENPTLYTTFYKNYVKKYINTTSTLTNSFIYEFEYNQRVNPLRTNPFYLNFKVEYSGLLLSAIDKIFKLDGKIFDITYARFVKFDLDVRKYFTLSPHSQLAMRFFGGIAVPTNGQTTVPFDKNYFMGGSNDLRGWTPFSVGPADEPFFDNFFAVDNFKLLSSIEYRFPLKNSLYGALFVDAGNVWGIDKNVPETLFTWKDFYNQLAIGPGLGFRYDFKYLMLRFDLAYKLADPQLPLGERFSFKNIQIFKPTINFAINVPF